MKKLIPDFWVNSKAIDMFAGWTFYLGLLLIAGFWSFHINNAIWVTVCIAAIVIAISGITAKQINMNLISRIRDFDSSEAEKLDGKYLFSSDAFPVYLDESNQMYYIVLYELKEMNKFHVFAVPAIWYHSLLDLPKHMATHFYFENAQLKHHKLHAVGLTTTIKPIRNHFIDMNSGERVKTEIA